MEEKLLIVFAFALVHLPQLGMIAIQQLALQHYLASDL